MLQIRQRLVHSRLGNVPLAALVQQAAQRPMRGNIIQRTLRPIAIRLDIGARSWQWLGFGIPLLNRRPVEHENRAADLVETGAIRYREIEPMPLAAVVVIDRLDDAVHGLRADYEC